MEGFSQEEKEIFQRLLIKAENNMLSKLGADQNKRRRKGERAENNRNKR